MTFHLFFAFLWIAMGAVYLHRAYSGVMSMGIVTLMTSEPVMIGKLGRLGRSLLGVEFLSIGVWHLVQYMRLAHPSG